MTRIETKRDIVVLAADKDIEATIKGIFNRHESLGIRAIDFQIYGHPEKDSGCHLRCQDFLRGYVNKYHYALVIHDKDGCGIEHQTREYLEADIEARMRASGWGDRCLALVIEPELEEWVWTDSPHVAVTFGWVNGYAEMKDWLESQGESFDVDGKPFKPKECMEAILRKTRTPRSSSLFLQLANTVSLRRCIDPTFNKLKLKLLEWFPA